MDIAIIFIVAVITWAASALYHDVPAEQMEGAKVACESVNLKLISSNAFTATCEGKVEVPLKKKKEK